MQKASIPLGRFFTTGNLLKNIDILNNELDLVNNSLKSLKAIEKNFNKKSFFYKIKNLFKKK